MYSLGDLLHRRAVSHACRTDNASEADLFWIAAFGSDLTGYPTTRPDRYCSEQCRAADADRHGFRCRQYDCIFLGEDKEAKEYYCKIYQTDYWYYGTCGRYPVDQRDIDDHACPGFVFDEAA